MPWSPLGGKPRFLRSKGFVFHRFSSVHGRPMKPLHLAANPLQPISQQLWADAVYVTSSGFGPFIRLVACGRLFKQAALGWTLHL